MYRYHYQPVLLETFVEKERFKGTCYKAANWQRLVVADSSHTNGTGLIASAPVRHSLRASVSPSASGSMARSMRWS